MEASSSEQQFCLRWNNHKSNLLTEFNELLQNEAFTDVTLVVEDGPSFIKCHKMVLAACSTYFQALFIHLPTNEQHPVIVLKDVKYSEMKAILEYMYQGEVSIAQNQLNELLKVAELLKVKGLVNDKSDDKPSRPRGNSISPPPAISTSTERSATYSNDSINNDISSPPHSTSSSPYYSYYGKSPSHTAQQQQITTPPVWNHFSRLSLAQSVMNTPITPSTPLFPRIFETEETNLRKKMGIMGANRDTPILRNVLGGQGHADSSQGISMIHGENVELHRSNSNGSANDGNEGRRSSLDLSGRSGHSPYPAEASMEEDDKKYSPMSGQNRKHKEWKRYKQYSKEDMQQAIEAVKTQKMTALKAAGMFRIPSRTLYDKVKKMGIITQRNGRRHLSTSGAHFPHGIGGNRNGSIYSGITDNDNDNDHHRQDSMMESSSALLELAYGNIREQQIEDETMSIDAMKRSSSPDDELNNDDEQDNDDRVQDLSVKRKNVIVPPVNPTIKEEQQDGTQN